MPENKTRYDGSRSLEPDGLATQLGESMGSAFPFSFAAPVANRGLGLRFSLIGRAPARSPQPKESFSIARVLIRWGAVLLGSVLVSFYRSGSVRGHG